jgi:hypothetical protein
MKSHDHLLSQAAQVSERLSVLQEPVDFFLGEKFDPQGHARFDQPTFVPVDGICRWSGGQEQSKAFRKTRG